MTKRELWDRTFQAAALTRMPEMAEAIATRAIQSCGDDLPAQVELTDEEVWLRAYCAAMVWEGRIHPAAVHASVALDEFRRKFRKPKEASPASDGR